MGILTAYFDSTSDLLCLSRRALYLVTHIHQSNGSIPTLPCYSYRSFFLVVSFLPNGLVFEQIEPAGFLMICLFGMDPRPDLQTS